MRAAVFAPRARQDLREAVTWIAQDNPAATRARRDAADRTLAPITASWSAGVSPACGLEARAPMGALISVGVHTLPPRILRVLHGARDLPDVLRDLNT